METRIVFHIDFDYFYAQCEEVKKPELKTKPVCVCVFSDRGGDSGAIATANYNARKYGVKSGMPIAFAKKKLEDRKDAVFLPVDFDYYIETSEKAMQVMKDNADVFEYVGKDEAYLDVTKRTGGDFDKASHLAQQIKIAIRDKVNLSCSVGISQNKLLSKMASDFKKPDGLTVISPEKTERFLDTMKIRAIPGIGTKTEKKFTEMKLETISDLKKIDIFTLHKEFGRKSGAFIYNAVRGIDNEQVKEREPSVQYSKITTLKKDSKEYQFLSENLSEVCKEVHKIVIKNNRMFKSIGIHFVQTDLTNKSKSKMLRNATNELEELKKIADQMLKEFLDTQTQSIRRLGVRVSELSDVQGQNSITTYF